MANRHRKRMSAQIGPNAILQTAHVIDRQLGEELRRELLAEAGIVRLPTGETMIDESDALALHYAIALELAPEDARAIALEAGAATADYIIAHRIPSTAARLLAWLPNWLAAPLLMKAISRHAWTFIGAGRFEAKNGWQFTIDRSQAPDPLAPPPSLFTWYGAVFSRLYQRLIDSSCECSPISGHDGSAHQFRISRNPDPPPVSKSVATAQPIVSRRDHAAYLPVMHLGNRSRQ